MLSELNRENHKNAINNKPFTGILSMEPTEDMVKNEKEHYASYIAASYVKYIESAGARVVPIRYSSM